MIFKNDFRETIITFDYRFMTIKQTKASEEGAVNLYMRNGIFLGCTPTQTSTPQARQTMAHPLERYEETESPRVAKFSYIFKF